MSSATVTLAEALTPIAATNSTIGYLGGRSTQLQFDILATVHHGAVVVQGAQVMTISYYLLCREYEPLTHDHHIPLVRC